MRMTLSRMCGLATIVVGAIHPYTQAATVCEHATATIVYVDADATGSDNGTSWANAYTDLQDALGNASGLTEIWVADGTYKPATSGRSNTFTMADDVHLYGGFDGTESNCPTSRDPANCSGGDYDGRPCAVSGECPGGGSCTGNVTILSGEITGANIYHVVTYETASADVTIDGFVIEDGQADGSSGIENQGGGLQVRSASTMYCYGGTNNGDSCTAPVDCALPGVCQIEFCLAGGPTVKNCLFRDNDASNHGAAVNDHGSSSSYDNCVFRDNAAAKGGGVLFDNGSSSITGCLFQDNTTDAPPNEGGALWLQGREGTWQCPSEPVPTITDTTFVGNISTDGPGGAMFSTATAPDLSGCTFDSNKVEGLGGGATDGGAAMWIENIPSGQPATITTSVFVGNEVDTFYGAFSSGGAIAFFGPGELHIDRTSFVQNDGRGNGGALALWLESTTTCTNCLFTGNYIDNSGYNLGSAVLIYEPITSGQTITVNLVNSTFVANESEGTAAPISVYSPPAGDSDVNVANCIFWDNEPNSGSLGSYSIIEGWTSGGTNTGDNPEFISDAVDCDSDGWGDPPCASGCGTGCDDYGDLRVECDSPAIDSGDNCAIDLDGDGSTSDDVPYDLDGNDRRVDAPGTSDGGNTDCPVNDVSAPMVDRGAYEFQVSCSENSDCCSGEVCCDDVCIVGQCCDEMDCDPQVCKTSNHTCVDCLDDGDCPFNQCCKRNACNPCAIP